MTSIIVPYNYSTITAAINAASNGDNIEIISGDYYVETLRSNNKFVSLKATDGLVSLKNDEKLNINEAISFNNLSGTVEPYTFPGNTYRLDKRFNFTKGIAVSHTGQYQILLFDYNDNDIDYVYVSNDYGQTLTRVRISTSNANNDGWWACSISTDGKYMVASKIKGGQGIAGHYYSNDFGVTFSLVKGKGSTDGKLYPIVLDDGQLYISDGTGIYKTNNPLDPNPTWTTIRTFGWLETPIAVNQSGSDKGKYILFTENFGDSYIFLSTDFGATFTNIFTNIGNTEHGLKMSRDGKNMIVGGSNIQISTNYGASWKIAKNKENGNDVFTAIFLVDTSLDGQYMVALGSQFIWYSDDYGTNWTNSGYSVRNLDGGLALSGDKSFIAFGGYTANIDGYTVKKKA